MMKTLFVVNPNAGRTRKIWRQILPRLSEWVQDYNVVMTRETDDLMGILDRARTDGVERIITVGGDGTNKYMLNAMMALRQKHPGHEFVFGSIPAGTGRDFARGIGLPLTSIKAAEYILTQAKVRPVDVGLVTFGGESHYFLNASNVGMANEVALRVERSAKRPWSFLTSVLGTLVNYKPEAVRIELDGKLWFEGKIYLAAIANGRSIGQGILIAPDAEIDDGYFDVVIGEEMPFLELAQVFPTIYTGKHIGHPRVKTQRAQKIRILAREGETIGIDLDGEPSDGAFEIRYEIIPGTLKMLL